MEQLNSYRYACISPAPGSIRVSDDPPESVHSFSQTACHLEQSTRAMKHSTVGGHFQGTAFHESDPQNFSDQTAWRVFTFQKKVYHSRSCFQASLAVIGRRLATKRDLLRENFPIPDQQGAGYGGVNRE